MSSMYVHGLILVFNKYVHLCLLESNAQGVGVLRILSDGLIKGFFGGGFEIFDSWIFLSYENLASMFFWVASFE